MAKTITADALKAPFFAQHNKGHGRVEQRHLHVFAIEPDAIGFAGARSIVVVRSKAHPSKTGQTKPKHRYYLSSQEPDERTPEQWHDLIRGHWAGVEIRNHWRRDHLWGEDRSRTRNAHALANFARLCSTLLGLIPLHHPDLPLKQLMERLQSNPSACLSLIQ